MTELLLVKRWHLATLLLGSTGSLPENCKFHHWLRVHQTHIFRNLRCIKVWKRQMINLGLLCTVDSIQCSDRHFLTVSEVYLGYLSRLKFFFRRKTRYKTTPPYNSRCLVYTHPHPPFFVVHQYLKCHWWVQYTLSSPGEIFDPSMLSIQDIDSPERLHAAAHSVTLRAFTFLYHTILYFISTFVV